MSRGLRAAPARREARARRRWSEAPIHREEAWGEEPLALTIRAHPPYWPTLSHSRFNVRALALAGVRPAADGAASAVNRMIAARAGEMDVDALPQWMHPWALAEQQRYAEATRLFAVRLAAGDPEAERLARHLVRARPTVYAPLLRAALPPERWLDLVRGSGAPKASAAVAYLNDPALAGLPLDSDELRLVALWRALLAAGERARARVEVARLRADPGALAAAVAEVAAEDGLRAAAASPDFAERVIEGYHRERGRR